MSDPASKEFKEAFAKGRVAGLGIAALAISCVAFVQLLGAEKAIVGLVLGIVAYRSVAEPNRGRQWALIAIAVSSLYLVFMLAVLIFAGDDILQAIQALDQAT